MQNRTESDPLVVAAGVSPDVTREVLILTSAEMPRLDAHLASVLMEAKHLKGELGLQFQAYTESKVTQYTPEGLSSFVDRVEYVLSSIPPELQPSEMTRYTWLYSRMRKVRVMQRHIDKIRDSRVGSHCRTYDWLFGKLKTCINEMKEDQNEEAVRSSLQKRLKDKDKDNKPKPKAAAATTKSEGTQEESKGLPNPKAKAKPKATQPNPKEKGSGEKGKGKKENKGKGPGQGEETKSNPKPKADPKPDKARVDCLFWGKGSCNRGDACPFYHDPAKKAAAKPKPSPSQPSASTAKAAVATIASVGNLASSSACSVASKGSTSSMGKSLIGRFMQFVATCVSMLTGAHTPGVCLRGNTVGSTSRCPSP